MSSEEKALLAGVHRRRNLLTNEWVLVSPHRTQRPWQGQIEKSEGVALPEHDPSCYLCPGNVRAGGIQNPHYADTFVFDNDFAALRPEPLTGSGYRRGLLEAEAESGLCRVLCYSPAHHLTLGQMQPAAIRSVIETWSSEYSQLGARDDIGAVTIFENRGAMMGASSPHPHGQIWANRTVPNELSREVHNQKHYFDETGQCLLCDYVKTELAEQERIVIQNDHFIVVVPFWATWPFETLLLPKSHHSTLAELAAEELDAMADVLKKINVCYDALFETMFPYTMGLHLPPTDGERHPSFHFHAHYYPPLLRSASIRKFMVGYEMLAGPQRDLTPETAAERLRSAI
jgi:UDPglucose--hexose-1-phosphate uridylyltransferase